MVLVFYATPPSSSQLVFFNRFCHDNMDRFNEKMQQAIQAATFRKDAHQLSLYNHSTFVGKSTLEKWTAPLLPALRLQPDDLFLRETEQERVYACRKLQRSVLMVLPSNVPLPRVEDHVFGVARDNLLKAYF